MAEDRLSTITKVAHQVTNGAGKVTLKIDATLEVSDMSPASASAQLLGIVNGFVAPAQAQVASDK